ncbi:MAG: single-stranded DNA-binding protein [bacterium]
MGNLKAPEINSVVIAGNLVGDPTYRYTSKGIAVSNFSLAVKRTFRDKSGNLKESICFVGIVAWHKLADICMKNLDKGSMVLIEGELQSRNIVSDDKKIRIVEVKARQIQFLGNNKKSEETIKTDTSNHSEHKTNKSTIENNVNNESTINVEKNDDDNNPMKGEFDFGFQDVQI